MVVYSFGGIDNYEWGDVVFEEVCNGNHKNVAEWLYSFSCIDIDQREDNLFLISCVRGNIEIAKWMYSLGEFDHIVKNLISVIEELKVS